MTSVHTNSICKPFLLEPVAKDYLWGGSRLRDEFGKDFTIEPLAETWECSTHSDGPSLISSGIMKGKSLVKVCENYPEMLGSNLQALKELPILIKFIDAKKDLSVQVHPDDAYAKANENGQNGKTEMWYVMDAEPDAKLVYGFYNDMDIETLKSSLDQGDIEKYLQKIAVKKNDVFFIEPGTVHAIGEGVLIAEIQQNSNVTYRMYDYNRLDKKGQMRPLHNDKALEVVNLKGSKEPKQPIRVLKYRKGAASELLCKCPYFQVERYLLNTEKSRQMVTIQTDSCSFQVYLCIDGCGVIFMEDGDNLNFFKGDCVFVPARSVGMKFHGTAQLLKVNC